MKAHHIPNALCVLRIVLVVPLVFSIMRGHYVVAFLLFGFAGFTDLLDGLLARRFGWYTQLGGILDPIADKTLAIAVFVALVLVNLVPLTLAVLVVARDFIIMAGGLAYRMFIGGFEGKASPMGKFHTAAMLLFVWMLLANAAFGLPTDAVVLTLGGLVVASTIVSGLAYVRTWGMMAWRNRTGTTR